MKKQKEISTLVGIIIIAIATIILFGGVFTYQYLAIREFQQVVKPDNQTTGFPMKIIETDAWKTYTNDQLMTMADKNWKSEAMYFKGLEGNFVIIDQGTAPDPRGLIIYNLSSKTQVLADRYSQPLEIAASAVSYWSPTDQKVTAQNCPDSSKWLSEGLGAEIESHVSFDLSTLTKKDLGQTRCHVVQ